MAGDGGYPSLWRRYIETANPTTVSIYINNIKNGVVDIRSQIKLDDAMLAAVIAAAEAAQDFLPSITTLNLRGNETTKQIALSLIDEMATALKGASGEYD